MKTLRDVKDFPKNLLRSKKISLYKAFVLNNDEVMNIDVNIDILSISEEDAIKHMIQSLSVEQIEELRHRPVSLAILTFNKEELLDKPLIDEGDIYFKDGNINITLKDKLYSVDVKDVNITELEYDVDPKTEIKNISELKMVSA